jgi:C4-dicarboxylate transporter DctQ subunit
MKALKRFDTIFDRMIRILFHVASGLSLVIVFGTATEILMRYFLNRPQIWAVEVTEYTMLYITFLGSAWLLREEGHVKMDILIWRTWLHYQKGVTTFTAMEVLMWPILIVIPFGCLLLLIQFVRRAYAYWEDFKSYKAAK